MKTIIGVDTVKLAGLKADTFQKVISGQITLEHWAWFNKLTKEKRDKLSGTKSDFSRREKEIEEKFYLFLFDAFTHWYDKNIAAKAPQSVELVSPADIDWDARKTDSDRSKFGEYTINPDTIGIEWECIPQEKIKTFDFKEFVGKPRSELAKHLVEHYADKYHIPGIEYWKYLYEKKDNIPTILKDGNYYYFFGSILRIKDGAWSIPDSRWVGGRWNRTALWLKDNWSSIGRVLLFEK